MESLKKFSTQGTGDAFLTMESLEQYDSYIHDVVCESDKCSRQAYEHVCMIPLSD